MWTCLSIHVSLCLEEFSPQTSPSGTNYPMVGVLSMCPPHHFSQIPTSGHLCRPARTRFFCLPGPSWLVHPLVHICVPFRTAPCTSAHLCCRQDNSLLWDPPTESSFRGQSISP